MWAFLKAVASNILEFLKLPLFLFLGILAFLICLGVIAMACTFWYVSYYYFTFMHDPLLGVCAGILWLAAMAFVGYIHKNWL